MKNEDKFTKNEGNCIYLNLFHLISSHCNSFHLNSIHINSQSISIKLQSIPNSSIVHKSSSNHVHLSWTIHIQSLKYETGQTGVFWDFLWRKNFVCMICETYLALECVPKSPWPTAFEKLKIHQPNLKKLQI